MGSSRATPKRLSGGLRSRERRGYLSGARAARWGYTVAGEREEPGRRGVELEGEIVMNKLGRVVVVIGLVASSAGAAGSADPPRKGAVVGHSTRHDVSPPLRSIRPVVPKRG